MTNPTYESFLHDVAEHKLTIFLDNGVHRHIQCRKANGSSTMFFDIVTWPGYLAYTGDMGSYVFRRLRDMFEFFRKADRSQIDLRYWAGKLEAADVSDGVKKFSADSLEQHCWDYMRSLRDRLPAEKRGEIGQAIIDEVLCAETDEDAHRRLHDFEVDGEPFFADAWEWDLTDYTYRFVWCCYAIVHAIGLYDAAKELKP